MKAYVQSYVRSRGYYWAEVTGLSSHEIEDLLPAHHLQYCLQFIDPSSPSILIAHVPAAQENELILLATKMGSVTDRSGNRIPPGAMLLVFDIREEVNVRALTAALLASSNEAASTNNLYNPQAIERLDTCIERTADSFTVTPNFFTAIAELISEGSVGFISGGFASHNHDSLAVRNSAKARADLVVMLRKTALPLRGLPEKPVPVIVVTGKKSPDSLVEAGAWRILTNLVTEPFWERVGAKSERPDESVEWQTSHVSEEETAPQIAQMTEEESKEQVSSSTDSAASKGEEIWDLAKWGQEASFLLRKLPRATRNSARKWFKPTPPRR